MLNPLKTRTYVWKYQSIPPPTPGFIAYWISNKILFCSTKAETKSYLIQWLIYQLMI